MKINVRDDAGEFYPVGRILLRLNQGKAEHCESFCMYPSGVVVSPEFYQHARKHMATLWSTPADFSAPLHFASLRVTVSDNNDHDMVLV